MSFNVSLSSTVQQAHFDNDNETYASYLTIACGEIKDKTKGIKHCAAAVVSLLAIS